MLKDGRDFGSANLSQHLLLHALQQGAFEKQVKTLCDAYTKKRDAMLEALDEYLGDFMPGETHWTHPTGGLYVWLTLPESIDTSRGSKLFTRAIELGMLYVPGAYCYPADPTRKVPTNQIRLSFGVPTIEQNREGVRLLAQAIRDVAGVNRCSYHRVIRLIPQSPAPNPKRPYVFIPIPRQTTGRRSPRHRAGRPAPDGRRPGRSTHMVYHRR